MAQHYLSRSKHVGFPTRQICLQVDYDRLENPLLAGTATDMLSSWSAVSWRGAPGQEEWLDSGDGVDAESCWRWIGQQQQKGACPWLWIEGACHALTLLGFWQLLESGEWYLTQEDANANGRAGNGEGKGTSGLCILEDTPTIILAIEASTRRAIKVVDIRNLGCDGIGTAADSAMAVGTAARWLWEWCRTIESLGLGGLRHTAAAQAWHGWRYGYLQTGVLIHENDDARALERDAIHPGRAEAFRVGNVPGYVYAADAAAHYPACAISGQLPVRLKWHGLCNMVQLAAAAKRGWYAIARCRVRCAAPYLPCRRNGLTIWPIGEWDCALAGAELWNAAERGCIVSVEQAALYEGGLPCERFVRTLWAAREQAGREGRRPARDCIKALLNSLVGKWASRQRAWVDAPESYPPGDWTTWYRIHGPERVMKRYRQIGKHVQREEIGADAPESCPALAAYTYAEGRVRLGNWIGVAGKENVHYVDSDSLFTSLEGYQRLDKDGCLQANVLGGLRLQGMYKKLHIGGIKLYTADGKTVAAGIPDGADYLADGTAQYWQPRTVRESVGTRAPPDGSARVVTIPLTRTYRHGHVSADGTVTPINVGGWANGKGSV